MGCSSVGTVSACSRSLLKTVRRGGHLDSWSARPSWLAGVALSTTSVAVVYAVMLELRFNTTEFGKATLAVCFINDLGTVIALSLIFSPFTSRTLVFVAISVAVFVTPRTHDRDGVGGYGWQRSRSDAKTQDAHLRIVNAVLHY
jgi:Kef-type K+ transport system membrane component KefB